MSLKEAGWRVEAFTVVERQYGYLELRGPRPRCVLTASAVLGSLGASAESAARPQVLASRITRVDSPGAF